MTCTGCNIAHAPHELVNGKCVQCLAKAYAVLEHRLDEAVNASCSCGGKGPDDDCCPACEVWHRFKHATR